MDPSLEISPAERYSRQLRFAPFGAAGQEKLAQAHAVIVGCGALGSAQAELLVRAGIGRLTLIDRDVVEISNLQRQTLFTEADALTARPKALAAQAHLAAINSRVEVRALVADLTPENIAGHLSGASLILDGCDNFETRYLLNDFALAQRRPWIYAAVEGAYGVSFTIRPGISACLQCLLGAEPPQADGACDVAGVLAGAVRWVAAVQNVEALKLLSGNDSALRTTVWRADLWHNQSRELAAPDRQPGCLACQGDYRWLRGESHSQTLTLCGRNAVQIRSPGRSLDLSGLQLRLHACGRLQSSQYLLKFWPHAGTLPAGATPSETGFELTIFPDGRAIVQGTSDPVLARRIYAQYLGG